MAKKHLKRNRFILLIAVALAVFAGTKYLSHRMKASTSTVRVTGRPNDPPDKNQKRSIAELTDEKVVVSYLKAHQHLPGYYITKSMARKKGWIPHKGNLCKVLPGKAIGGDYFGNREGELPGRKGRKYYEADINYHCGRRGSERVVFSNDGLIFVTKNHYKSFQQK